MRRDDHRGDISLDNSDNQQLQLPPFPPLQCDTAGMDPRAQGAHPVQR